MRVSGLYLTVEIIEQIRCIYRNKCNAYIVSSQWKVGKARP